MATNSSIKRAFGNHNMVTQYLEFLTNPNVLIPPFRPVLYRSIACGGTNDHYANSINDRSYHEAKNRQVMNQLTDQYNIYQQMQRGE